MKKIYIQLTIIFISGYGDKEFLITLLVEIVWQGWISTSEFDRWLLTDITAK